MRAGSTFAIGALLLASWGFANGQQNNVGVTPHLPSGNATEPVMPKPPVDSKALDAEPEFEVATVKPSNPDDCCARTWGRNGRHFQTNNTNLRWLLLWAYGLNAKQVVGGPAWMDEQRFDVSGELDSTQIPTERQWRIALQKLLIDRFQIQLHHEKQEMAAYVVTVAKGGPKLTPSTGDHREKSTGFSGGVGQTMHGGGADVTVADFFAEIARLATDKPIVDQTGLTGIYDMQIAFTREDPNSLGVTQLPDTAAPNLFDAVQQQLGLKLVGEKAPVDVIVVDHAEPPGAN
jgi:uncharacterized protein (TIGR03435 family)